MIVKKYPVLSLMLLLSTLLLILGTSSFLLKYQLSDKQIQKIVRDSLQVNFPQSVISVSVPEMGLSSKLKYKFDEIQIKNSALFGDIVLKGISLKVPYLAILGGQDMDISIESVDILHFSHGQLRQYVAGKVQPLNQVISNKILAGNRVNLQMTNIRFLESSENSKNFLFMEKIKKLYFKDIHLNGGVTAVEALFPLSLIKEGQPNIDMHFLAIGHVDLNAWLLKGLLKSRFLMELKEVSEPEWYPFIGTQINIDPMKGDSYLDFNLSWSNSLGEGTCQTSLYDQILSVHDISANINMWEVSNQFKYLASYRALFTNIFQEDYFYPKQVKVLGKLDYDVRTDFWYPKLTAQSLEKNQQWYWGINRIGLQDLIEHQFKLGTDLSGQQVYLVCSSITCSDSLKSIKIGYLNSASKSSDVSHRRLSTIHEVADDLWKNMSLIMPLKPMPLEIKFESFRWGDFTFDLDALLTADPKKFASEHIYVGMNSHKYVEMTLSYSQLESLSQFTAFYKLSKLPVSVLLSFLNLDNLLKAQGNASGEMGYSASEESTLNINLDFWDTVISWSKFEDLILKKIFAKPEDQKLYPALLLPNTKAHYKLVARKNDKDLEFLLINLQQKYMEISGTYTFSSNQGELKIKYIKLSPAIKKYMLKTHNSLEVSIPFKMEEGQIKHL
jgi:hypothetical protein